MIEKHGVRLAHAPHQLVGVLVVLGSDLSDAVAVPGRLVERGDGRHDVPVLLLRELGREREEDVLGAANVIVVEVPLDGAAAAAVVVAWERAGTG